MFKAVMPIVALAAVVMLPAPSATATTLLNGDQSAALTTDLSAAKNQARSHSAPARSAAPKSHAPKMNAQKSHAPKSHAQKSHAPKSNQAHQSKSQKHASSPKQSKQSHTPKSQAKSHQPKSQGKSQQAKPLNPSHKTKQAGGKGKNNNKQVHKKLPNGPGKSKQAGGKLKKGPGKGTNTRIVDSWHGWSKPARIGIWRDHRRIWWGGGWHTFVPAVALATWVIGTEELYADGYVAIAAPACVGYTEDGCRLRWQQVDFVDGGSEYQCVNYCKQRNRAVAELTLAEDDETTGTGSPVAAVTAAPADTMQTAATGGACEMTIYGEQDFKGVSAENQDDQPSLADDGWKNEISSIEIKSGSWDFFTDDNYGGDTMRLKAGAYRTLDPAWTRKIGSFMCNRVASN